MREIQKGIDMILGKGPAITATVAADNLLLSHFSLTKYVHIYIYILCAYSKFSYLHSCWHRYWRFTPG